MNEPRNGWHFREVWFENGEPTMHREPSKPEPYGYLVRRNFKEPRFVEADNIEGVPNLPFNNPEYQPLYTIPPQRPWQGLTEQESGAIMEELNAYGTRLYEFARAIEDALKEKNAF